VLFVTSIKTQFVGKLWFPWRRFVARGCVDDLLLKGNKRIITEKDLMKFPIKLGKFDA